MALTATSPAFSKTLLLECAVTGNVSVMRADGGPHDPDKTLDPATLQIEVDEIGKTLKIDIDGPSDYELLVTSVPSEKNKVEAASVNADSYVLSTVKAFDSFTLDASVIIKRKTGAFSVKKNFVFTGAVRHYRLISYSGTCNKVSRTTNKF